MIQSRVTKIYCTGSEAEASLADGRRVTKDSPQLKLANGPFNQPRVTPAGPQPKTFDEAVNLMLKEGHDPRGSIEAARGRWPRLFDEWVYELRNPDER